MSDNALPADSVAEALRLLDIARTQAGHFGREYDGLLDPARIAALRMPVDRARARLKGAPAAAPAQTAICAELRLALRDAHRVLIEEIKNQQAYGDALSSLDQYVVWAHNALLPPPGPFTAAANPTQPEEHANA